MSGGDLSAPTEGTSFFMVDVVLVMCGFSGFSFWALRCSSTLLWPLSLRSAKRGVVVDSSRAAGLEVADAVVRMDRRNRREDCMLYVCRLGAE